MMAATAKARLPQPIRPSTELPRVRAVFLDSSTQVRMLDLNELAQLSRLMPLIVLVVQSPSSRSNCSGPNRSAFR